MSNQTKLQPAVGFVVGFLDTDCRNDRFAISEWQVVSVARTESEAWNEADENFDSEQSSRAIDDCECFSVGSEEVFAFLQFCEGDGCPLDLRSVGNPDCVSCVIDLDAPEQVFELPQFTHWLHIDNELRDDILAGDYQIEITTPEDQRLDAWSCRTTLSAHGVAEEGSQKLINNKRYELILYGEIPQGAIVKKSGVFVPYRKGDCLTVWEPTEKESFR